VPFNTLQKPCMKMSCIMEAGRLERELKQKRETREWKAETRRRRQNAMTLQDWIDRAQEYINRFVVLEDRQKGCISCSDGDAMDSGHYFHRGSKYRTSWLTLDRRNLTGQCRACNSYKGGGNQHGYRNGYIARYGQAAFEELEELQRQEDRGETPKPTIEEVKAFIEATKAKIKAFKAHQEGI